MNIRLSLQTKILVVISSIVLFITILFSAIFSYFEYKDIEEQMGQTALQVATTLSFMPTIKHAFSTENPETIIQPIALQVQYFTGAEFIVVGNSESIRYAHPDPEKIGRKMVGGDNALALLNGEYYISKATGTLGPSLRGKAPIFNDNEEIIGVVSVGFLIEDIQTIIYSRLLKISGIALVVLLIGIACGVLLTRNIRKDTMGLEPYQIASLYRDRNAVLTSIEEGIIAIDNKGRITMFNEYAQKLAGLSMNDMKKNIEDIFPDINVSHEANKVKQKNHKEIILNNRYVILKQTPIIENGTETGAVFSIRDKTEIQEMINTLSEVRKYSEDLRAQTHEYTNKLYAISGLLQLGEYDEAIDFIEAESKNVNIQNRMLTEHIKDTTVQAILLAKIAKASEQKVLLQIDSNSDLNPLSGYIDMAKLITILGNLLDNAIEAVEGNEDKQVMFFATDLGEDIIFEVADNGIGISDDKMDQIFQQGFSTKDKKHRGYGLAIVKETINDVDGQIEVQRQSTGGTVFAVYIPKQRKSGMKGGKNRD